MRDYTIAFKEKIGDTALDREQTEIVSRSFLLGIALLIASAMIFAEFIFSPLYSR